MTTRSPHKPADIVTPFGKLQLRYGLKTPGQIKLKIIWFHVKELIKAQYPQGMNARTLAKYDRDWQLCEKEEANKKGG